MISRLAGFWGSSEECPSHIFRRIGNLRRHGLENRPTSLPFLFDTVLGSVRHSVTKSRNDSS